MSLTIYRTSEHVPPHPGGKEIHVAELCAAQARRGHDVSLWWRYGAPGVAGARMHRVRTPWPGDLRLGVASAAAFAAGAAGQMRRLPRPDVVHAHGDFPDAAFVGRTARQLGVPSVLTVHGGLNPLWRRASRRAFRHVDRFIAVGDNVAQDLVDCGVVEDRITVLSSGVNPALLAPHAGGRERRPRSVATVGALQAVKGVDVLLDALRLLRDEGRPAALTVVGDGPERTALERSASDLADVTFTGRLDRDGVYSVLAGSQVFALASRPMRRKAEGTPTALLEAMSLGVPVVATRTGGIPALLRHGTDALLVAPDDPVALAAALDRLLGDEGLREALALSARERASGRDWDSVAAAVEAVYDSAASS